ncbi:hypothetical protein [Bartonella senegalensis]|uniref:hypothetical protein n=1 Tax=Bartonella senegalensis TaxID=1468418 RepID=UPI000688C468
MPPIGTKPFYGYGITAKNGGTFKMIGGSINVYANAIGLTGSDSDENKLENVIITNSEADKILMRAITTYEKSKLTLKNVTVTEASSSIEADGHSEITVSGGSFGGKIWAKNGSIII